MRCKGIRPGWWAASGLTAPKPCAIRCRLFQPGQSAHSLVTLLIWIGQICLWIRYLLRIMLHLFQVGADFFFWIMLGRGETFPVDQKKDHEPSQNETICTALTMICLVSTLFAFTIPRIWNRRMTGLSASVKASAIARCAVWRPAPRKPSGGSTSQNFWGRRYGSERPDA
jgi:hypothetical protein